MDEELTLGDIGVRNNMHDEKDVWVVCQHVLEDLKELVAGEALNELVGFGGRDLEGVERVLLLRTRERE